MNLEGTGAAFRETEFSDETSMVSNGEFRALFESAPDAIFVEDLEGTMLDVNPAACRLHGLSREELVGRNFADLVPPQHRARVRESFANLVMGKADKVEGFSYGKDGRPIPVSARVSHICHLGRPALLFHISDISDQRLLEEQLRQSQRLESIGRLAGGVAHDFNNLLTAILGYTELSIQALEPDHEVQDGLLEIRRAGTQAADLTRQLLAFSRQQVLRPKVQDLNKIVVKMESLLRRTLGENIEIGIELDPAVEPVKVDGGQVEQVLLNLVLNARDAMPGGGRLLIETRNAVVDEEYAAAHSPMRPGEFVALTVTDTGCGMNQDTLGNIFEPFFTTKAPEKGTGLGLSTVYGIVKQSGGFIWVDSRQGEGTAIDILLPPAQALTGEAPADPDLGPVVQKGRTVLLVEDNQVVRRLSGRVLGDLGYSVLTARDAEQALAMSEAHEGKIDLLITDLVLPGKDGLTLARLVLDKRPDTRTIVMTGYSKNARFDPEPSFGGASFLQKPFTPADLERAVALALQ